MDRFVAALLAMTVQGVASNLGQDGGGMQC